MPIQKKKTVAGVVGLGYVGFPTMLALAKTGIKTVGVDVNHKRVTRINRGESHIAEISRDEVQKARSHFNATTDWSHLKKCNVIIIAVPTPLTKNKTPDTSMIENAGREISKYLTRGTLVILESTSYPGTTEELLKPILEENGFTAGKDFHLAFAPERVDPGNKEFKLTDIPKVVGGIDKKSTDRAVEFYKLFHTHVHPVSTPRHAEMTKVLENIFRLVNISLVNELKMLADKMGIDFWEVIEAAKTKPFGFMPFYPSAGVGGHCIPLDPYYLSWKARELHFFTRFIELAGEINHYMPHHVLTKVMWALNKQKKSMKGSKILVLGAAYKKDIDDPRESPAIHILWDLIRKGAKVFYNDPHVPSVRINMHPYNPTIDTKRARIVRSIPLTPQLLKRMDCVLILTDHTAYNYPMIARNSKLIIDTRNAIKRKSSKIIT